ncbi:MAG TPA: protein kinase [Polyangiales bacterium]|nr:protein kinase [Polyangiales bacterium]
MPSVKPSQPNPASLRSALRYQVSERIARGGMGEVFRAFDSATGEVVALKRVMVDDPARLQLFVSAFEREYQVLASLDHPRIIRVFDYGVDSEGPYYTMELVRGADLNKVAPLPWREVCQLMRDVATSLALLHARRLLHRDLSPKNVKITADGHGKLLDFGALADFGLNGTLVGTAPMVAPEALRGEPLDQRTDLYALGALTYWALTGRHAFPAPRVDDLEEYWEQPPRLPSSYVPEIPSALEQLVLALLSATRLARPSSAAEVIARLTVIGDLPPEAEADQRRIAQSFLIAPPFVGRDEPLRALSGALRASREGRGSAFRIEAVAGSGRTRLLEEIGVRAQLAGSTVLRVDASMHPHHNGTARALALRLLDALPELARECAKRSAASINALGRDVEARLALFPSRPPLLGPEPPDAGWDLSEWLRDVARHRPLMIAIDNVEACDAASTGMLLSLAQHAPEHALFLVLTERVQRDVAKGLTLLRARCQTLALANLTLLETEALGRGLFGDAPHVERFAEWLHACTAGSPLHCVEISRQLIAQDVIQHDGGLWSLPASRPQVVLSAALEDALSTRIAHLSPDALRLAQLLALQRAEPKLALCTALLDEQAAPGRALALLDELARNEILHSDLAGYRFVSAALRDALLASMDAPERERAHRRLGLVLERLAGADAEQRIQAGWHLMRGGEELRGAELVATTLCIESNLRSFMFGGAQIGAMAEAALAVFKQHRRSNYERQPLLTALATAGFFEDRVYALRYTDETLDLIEDIVGLRLARRLARWLGPLSLLFGLAVAWFGHWLTPKAERPLSFHYVMRYATTAIVPLVGAAAVSLDAERADRIASVLGPFARLPIRATLRAVYEVCIGLKEIGREHQARVTVHFEAMGRRISSRDWYPLLPDESRKILSAATHFVRGAFAVFRANDTQALEHIAELESCGVKLYGMVASQLRFLLHTYRCELAQAERYRARVEVYAAHVGSAWQVELWEPAALLPLHLITGDVVATVHTVRRFDELVDEAPSLRFYRQLGEHVLSLLRHEGVWNRVLAELESAERVFREREPRTFIGWAAAAAGIAAAYNRLGRHAEARAFCDQVQVHIEDRDRDYVMMFLDIDLQTALADLGLGKLAAARARIDGLLARHRESGHALCLGSLHEVRARIAHAAGDVQEYHEQRALMAAHFLPTGYPPLIAKCERIAALEDNTAGRASTPDDGVDHTTVIERR